MGEAAQRNGHRGSDNGIAVMIDVNRLADLRKLL